MKVFVKKLDYAFIALISLGILLFFYNKGLSMEDEGYILHAAQRLYNEEFPYRDFNFIYTPGSLFLISFAYFILGESILTGRILVLVISFATTIIFYYISKFLTKNKFISILTALVYLAWGPSHINFPFPVIFCILLGSTTLIILQKILKKPKNNLFLLLGINIFILFFFKQNFGLALVFGYFSLIYFNKKLKKGIPYYSTGLIIGLLAFVMYLLSTNSFTNFLNYSKYAFDQYFIEKNIIAPSLINPKAKNFSLVKVIAYILPLFLASCVFLLSLKRKELILVRASSLFVGLYYLVGIYPSVDYVHISPLLSLSGIALASLMLLNKAKFKILLYLLFLLLIIIGFYTAIFKGYYRWGPPVTEQDVFLNHPRMMVWNNSKEIISITNYIQNNSGKNDYVYFYFYEPMIYFLSDRKNPIKYIDSFLPNEKMKKNM